jgi:hypothetical protein
MDYHSSFLEIKDSTIIGAGRGLFAKRAFAPNEFIDVYYGRIVDDNNYESSAYAYHLSKHKTILPEAFDCWSMYANDLSIFGLPCNSYFADFNQAIELKRVENNQVQKEYVTSLIDKRASSKVCIRAKFHIRKGEEIFVDYGDSYWKYADSNLMKQVDVCKNYARKSIKRIKKQLGEMRKHVKYNESVKTKKKTCKTKNKRNPNEWVVLWPAQPGPTQASKVSYRIG